MTLDSVTRISTVHFEALGVIRAHLPDALRPVRSLPQMAGMSIGGERATYYQPMHSE